MNAFAKAILGYVLTIVSLRIVSAERAVGAALAVASLANEAIVAVLSSLLLQAPIVILTRAAIARAVATGIAGGRSRGGADVPVARMVEAEKVEETEVRKIVATSGARGVVLRIREDRQVLVRRIEISRVGVGAHPRRLLAVAYWYHPDRPRRLLLHLSENNRIRAVKITAPRGYVLDRNGAILVENEPAYTLHLYRREARNLDDSIDFIVGLLDLNPASRSEVARRARACGTPEFVPIPIAENLAIEEVAAVEARAVEHPEFAITVSQRRLYTRGGAAAHALGYLSEATPEQIKAAEQHLPARRLDRAEGHRGRVRGAARRRQRRAARHRRLARPRSRGGATASRPGPGRTSS